MARHDDDRLPDRNAVACRIHLCCGRQHHPGRVVTVEHQRSFNGPLRQDHLAGPEPPQFLARAIACVGQMVGQPLHRTDEIVVIMSKCRGARQDRDIGRSAERGDAGVQPRPQGRVGQGTTAGFVLIVDHNHPPAAANRGQRRRNPGRPCPDDQHIAMGIGGRIVIGVLFGRGLAKARHAPDRRLVQLVPKRARPHEGLVVKTSREKHPQPVVDRAEIGFERGPAVLADRRQAVMNFNTGRPQIRGETPGAAINRDQRIGFLAARRQQATWSVIFEGSAK